jgi:hypothetical protein
MGGHGLPKASPGLAMPYPMAVSGVAHRAGGLQPSSTSLDTPHRTPMSRRAEKKRYFANPRAVRFKQIVNIYCRLPKKKERSSIN